MIRTAFVLGAGLGTRLRPLTDLLPKPLIPIFHKPLITFAFDHLLAQGFDQFIVNTHHLAKCYDDVFPDYRYGKQEIVFRHEKHRLETGGGIKNIEDLVHGEPLLVYNGDILSDLPIERAMADHERSGRLVTMVLRSSGGPLQVALDPSTGAILDIAQRLGTAPDARRYLFTGIYILEADIFAHIPAHEHISIIPILCNLIRDQPGSVGGIVLDAGHWWDLGTPAQYLDVHRHFYDLYLEADDPSKVDWPTPIQPSSRIVDTALEGLISIGKNVDLARGSSLRDVIVWPGTKFPSPVHYANGILSPVGFLPA
jgi:NDP-sugar pyrophosphorylase family protein